MADKDKTILWWAIYTYQPNEIRRWRVVTSRGTRLTVMAEVMPYLNQFLPVYPLVRQRQPLTF